MSATSATLSHKRLFTLVIFLAANLALLSTRVGAAEVQGSKPIQDAITGNEDLGDLSQPQQALAQFYRAFNTRDLKMIDENFAHSE